MRMPSFTMMSAILALLLQYTGGGSSGITVESGGTANTVPKFSAGPVLVDSLFTDTGSLGGYSGASGFQADFFFPTAANGASTGVFRLNNNTKSCWRNAANSADLCIWYDGSDVFNIDGSSSGTIWDLTNVAEPATPSAGVTSVYVDSTSKTLSAINDTGTVSNAVVAATCSAGDYISAVSAAGVLTCGTPAGGSYDPLDTTVLYWREDFGTGHAAAVEQVGELGWREQESNSCTPAKAVGDHPNWGLHKMTTGSTANDMCGLSLGSNTTEPLDDMSAVNNWDSKFIFKADSTASIHVRIGFLAHPGITTSNGIFLRYDTASDTNFMLCVDGASTVCWDTSVAADTSWHQLRVRSTTIGTILMTLDSGSERSFCAAACDETITPPTDAMSPTFQVSTLTTATKLLTADFFAMTATGLTRF